MMIGGRQLLLDAAACGCDLDDEETYRGLVAEITARARVQLIDLRLHRFGPEAWTVSAMLAESHLALHTYPSRRFVSLDVVTCADLFPWEALIEVARRRLLPQSLCFRCLERTLDPATGRPRHRLVAAGERVYQPSPATTTR